MNYVVHTTSLLCVPFHADQITAGAALRGNVAFSSNSASFLYYNVDLPSFDDFERKHYRQLCEDLSASANFLQPTYVEGNLFDESAIEREAFVAALAAVDDAAAAAANAVWPGTPGRWLYLEIGFNAGHSAAMVLSSFPQARVKSFDICAHAYVDPNAKLLEAKFGPGRFGLTCGDSRMSIPAAATASEGASAFTDLADAIRIDGKK